MSAKDDRPATNAELSAAVRAIAAKNAGLAAALRLVRDYVVTMKGRGHQYQIAIDAALSSMNATDSTRTTATHEDSDVKTETDSAVAPAPVGELPVIDYTLTVYKERDGLFAVTSSVPGLFLAGPDLLRLLADVPLAVKLLRELNGPDLPQAVPPSGDPFQGRVQPWMMACFGEEISNDLLERSDRFIEEALELVQAGGYAKERAHQLVEYVYGRPQGDISQEVGGVMVTLAALCLARGVDMHSAGETELARIWTKVEQIRAKQAAKPHGKALPIAVTRPTTSECQHEHVCSDGMCLICGEGRPTTSAGGDSGEREAQLCDTTNTPRFRISVDDDCDCGTYAGNLGPCLTFAPGKELGRCAYCDHAVDCHDHAWGIYGNALRDAVAARASLQAPQAPTPVDRLREGGLHIATACLVWNFALGNNERAGRYEDGRWYRLYVSGLACYHHGGPALKDVAHKGDPCEFCRTPHDDVEAGACPARVAPSKETE